MQQLSLGFGPVIASGNVSFEKVNLPASLIDSSSVSLPVSHGVSIDGVSQSVSYNRLSTSNSSLLQQIDSPIATNLDISEPNQLMSLLASADDVVMDIIPEEEEISANSSIDALFLPPHIEKHLEPATKRHSKPNSHKLLTSMKVLEQKRALVEKKSKKKIKSQEGAELGIQI